MLDWSWLIQLSLLCVRCMYGCGNCFGRFTKSQKLDARSSKEHLEQDKVEEVPLNDPINETTSSSNEMDNNGSNSRQQRSSSSIVSANHRVPEIRPIAETDANVPYVNHALRMWTERRREWVGTRERPRPVQHREPVISWSTTYEDLLGTSRLFTQPIPLPEMVDFLVDVWEQEGLYE